MRKFTFFFLGIVCAVMLQAQVPEAFKYQAVIRDGDGNIVANQQVGLRFTINKAEVNKSIIYQETQSATTNNFGIVNLNIGYGTPVIGNFASIDWSNGIYMLEVEVDPTGGTSYVSLGVSSILSVPYALYAKSSGGGGGSLWEQNGDDIYYWDGNVGIRTNTPEFKLTLDEDGGILAKGTLNSGATLQTSGIGSRLIWYPRKAAFRAGYVFDEWDDENIGDFSTATGYLTKASNDYAIAMGMMSNANGVASVAIGQSLDANGSSSLALGSNSAAIGEGSVAIGFFNSSYGFKSFTFGNYLKADAENAFVLGKGSGINSLLTNTIPNSLMIGFDDTPVMVVNDKHVCIGTSSFNTNYTLHVKATEGTHAIMGEGEDEGGVYGYSLNATGVYGASYNGTGVWAGSFFGTALHAEHFIGGVAAELVTSSGENPVLKIIQENSGPLLQGFGNGNDDDEVLNIAGTGKIDLYNGYHTRTVRINPYESGTSDGGAITLYNGAGTPTIKLDAAEWGGADGSQITLYNQYGDVTIEIDGNHENNEGRITTNVLEITGGSDVAEPFDFRTEEEIHPGMVVSIDPENPGMLKVSEKAYDKCVAGIVSGAGSINTGLLLSQKGSIAQGKYPVALSGRVYCLATNENGNIQPGDLLTTSDLAGHVMKAGNTEISQGAIVGKAMTKLDEDTGLILVLVNLQ